MVDIRLLREWREFADMDLDTAEYLAFNKWPTPYEIICYHCQQSAEKYLKGFLLLHDEEPPRIHELVKLRELCENIDPQFATIFRVCSNLTQYGVQPRYPAHSRIDKETMLRALRDAQAVSVFMRQTAPDMFQEPAPSTNYTEQQ